MTDIVSDREPDLKKNYCRSENVMWKTDGKIYGKKLGGKTW